MLTSMLIVQLIKDHGILTSAQIATFTGETEKRVRTYLAELRHKGIIEIAHKRGPGKAANCYHYDLPRKRTYPWIGAGEYLGWRPSGTCPLDIRPAIAR